VTKKTLSVVYPWQWPQAADCAHRALINGPSEWPDVRFIEIEMM
jgi:hypothetical protein